MTRNLAEKPLTEKQEEFAVQFVLLGNAADAYRKAYEVSPDARDSWIYVEAAQLRDHPKVAARIQELQAEAKKQGFYTVEKAHNELEEARLVAKKTGQASAMVKATEGKMKLHGMDKPKRIEHSSPDGTMTPTVILRKIVDPKDGA